MSAYDNWIAAGKTPPIIWMPLKDAATAHINLGTGGNFTANGTFATSNRGANQDNCVASTFDGTADYLSRTSFTQVTSKTLTLSFLCKNTSSSGFDVYINNLNSSFQPRIYVNVAYTMEIRFYNSSSSTIILGSSIPIGGASYGRNIHVSACIDTTDINISKVFINGVEAVFTWNTFINDSIDIQNIMVLNGAYQSGYKSTDGASGEYYLDTKYIDLATNNPFWDSVENKPIPVRKVIADTGVVPLIAMPIRADIPGKNYGTGGDFTVNSGPYVGARSASEFWARSAKFVDGSVNYMQLTSTQFPTDSKTMTLVAAIKKPIVGNQFAITCMNTARNTRSLSVVCGTAGEITVTLFNQAGTLIANDALSPAIVNQYQLVLISVNTATATCTLYVNSSSKSLAITANSILYFYDLFSLAKSLSDIDYDGEIASMYFTTDYIDFSQEVNRLKFVDGLGYPLDLASQIDKGIIPKPLIYLPFDDPTSLGKNLGTGGNFTVNGAVTAGSDVNG